MDRPLDFCEIESILSIGEGMRVCLDLADRLEPEEGVLLGDTGHGYLLVLSENQSSETYPPRPFRVNCGAIHHYLFCEDEKTRYLSDLTPEMSVLAVHGQTGAQRRVPIGRIKMEKRPFLRVIATHQGRRVSVTLQEADSVRLLSKSRGAIDVKLVQPGDAVCFLPDQPGRHLGERIEESIEEV
ncbi:MAG TPA: 3-dehydroquinate synthase II [Opitutales bacterium]|nr:3-dehydroquinate synthase II [Opitutales bacterium]